LTNDSHIRGVGGDFYNINKIKHYSHLSNEGQQKKLFSVSDIGGEVATKAELGNNSFNWVKN